MDSTTKWILYEEGFRNYIAFVNAAFNLLFFSEVLTC